MRILLDENLPQGLRHRFPGHDAVTSAYMGWTGVQNGTLLDLAEAHAFDVFLTADQGIPFQQDFRQRKVVIIVLVARDTQLETLEPLVPRIQEALEIERGGVGKVIYIGS